jgi:hypothetical protein
MSMLLFLDQHVLSNGAIVFPISPILCTGEYIKLFTETLLAFIQPAFPTYRKTKYTIRNSVKFELETTLGFYIYFIFARDSCV